MQLELIFSDALYSIGPLIWFESELDGFTKSRTRQLVLRLNDASFDHDGSDKPTIAAVVIQ
jgi:hypothetical protein